MDELINNCLTIVPMLDNLPSLSSSLMVARVSSRKNKEMPVKTRQLVDCVVKCKNFYGERFLGSRKARTVLLPCLLTQLTLTAQSLVASSGVPHIQESHTMPQDNSIQQAQAEQHHPNIIADNMARPLLSEWVSGNQEGD
jgi:hypothetical protein